MSKGKLSKRQAERIQQKRRQTARPNESVPSDELENLHPGLVLSRYGNQADVESDNGETQRCTFRKHLGSPVAGDRVFWRTDGKQGVIETLCPRKSALQRPDSFGNLKTIAANVDYVMITLAISPEPHPNLIDRYLVAAANLDLKACILINKCDLLNAANRGPIQQIIDCYNPLGIPILNISAKSQQGFADLQNILREQTSVFVGQSGVGKSSILQYLMPNQQIKIGDNSDYLAKGKHTTTNAKLYHFPAGGDCIDSPGIREFGLWHLSAADVLRGFPDLIVHAENCKYRNCSHESETSCALLSALQSGEIDPQRYASFKRILRSLDDVKIKTKNLNPI